MVDIVYLELPNAFNNVHQEKLLNKFNSHGIIGHDLAWIGKWLKKREQSVRINEQFL